MVPKVDEDGNEIAGVRVPDITVPRGTHTGWNHRRAGHAEGELILLGSYFPFAATKQERLAANDPRPSLEERYRSNDHYLNSISHAARKLQEDRLLLGEDVERIVKAAAARMSHSRPVK
jgi:hypothetical protein